MKRKPKYTYTLTAWERKELEKVLSAKVCGKEKRLRAYVLLRGDVGQKDGCWPDSKIMEAYGVSQSQIYTTRKNMVENGLESALNRKARMNSPRKRKLDGDKEAHLTVLACSEAPEGYGRWTLKLLAGKLVQLNIVDSISPECVRQTLKKTNLSPG